MFEKVTVEDREKLALQRALGAGKREGKRSPHHGEHRAGCCGESRGREHPLAPGTLYLLHT